MSITYNGQIWWVVGFDYAANNVWEVAEESEHDSHDGEGKVEQCVVEDTILNETSFCMNNQKEPKINDTWRVQKNLF